MLRRAVHEEEIMEIKGMFERRQFVALLEAEFKKNGRNTWMAIFALYFFVCYPILFATFGMLNVGGVNQPRLMFTIWVIHAIGLYGALAILALLDWSRTERCVQTVLRKSPRIRHGLRDSRPYVWADADEDSIWAPETLQEKNEPLRLRIVH